MGKSLIIKGADFSQNGLDGGTLHDRTITGNQMSWTRGKYIQYSDGTAASLNGFNYSDAIEVADGYANLVISHCWSSGGAFYDSNMNYLGGIYTSGDETTPTTHAIPSGTRYVRVNCNNGFFNSFYITLKV